MDYLFDFKQKFSFRRFYKEHGAGIYAAILFHLILLVFLLGSHLYSAVTGRTSILIDFSGQDRQVARQRKEQKEMQAKEIAAKQLDEMLNARLSQRARNVAVDVSVSNQPLRDDRRTDVSQLNTEAQELQRKLDAARRQLTQQQGSDEVKTPGQQQSQQEVYKGPTVLTYDLGGRKAMSLPVPAYTCRGGGDVTVIIDVNPQGYVVAAAVQTAASTNDACLHEAALRFARASRFAVQPNAPARQRGNIVYRFIAQ